MIGSRSREKAGSPESEDQLVVSQLTIFSQSELGERALLTLETAALGQYRRSWRGTAWSGVGSWSNRSACIRLDVQRDSESYGVTTARPPELLLAESQRTP
jgi:hypothetical protein